MKHENRSGALGVLLRCNWLVCALPARSVLRLVLAEEVVVHGELDASGASSASSASSASRASRACGVAEIGGQRYPAWDLGHLMDVGATSYGWALVEVKHRGSPVLLALRTGPSMLVTQILANLAVPTSVLRDRPRAIEGAFPVSTLVKGVDTSTGALGVLVDPAGLWTPEELDVGLALSNAHPEAGGDVFA